MLCGYGIIAASYPNIVTGAFHFSLLATCKAAAFHWAGLSLYETIHSALIGTHGIMKGAIPGNPCIWDRYIFWLLACLPSFGCFGIEAIANIHIIGFILKNGPINWAVLKDYNICISL